MNQTNEKSIDQLHLQWIMGRNRNNSTLNSDELQLLLDNHRIELIDLTYADKEKLRLVKANKLEINKAAVSMNSATKLSKTAIMALSLLVEGLQIEAFEQWKKLKPEVDWKSMHPNLLKGLAIDRFRYIYGMSPNNYKQQLLESFL